MNLSARYTAVFLSGVLFLFAAQQAWKLMDSCDEKYDLLNSARQCGAGTVLGEWDYEPLREKLTLRKAELKEAGVVSHVSIYFRDLDHGPRFGIGEYDQFQPASLLKLPVLIAFLHLANRDPKRLDETLSFSGDIKLEQNLEQADETIQPDTPYTIRELLRKMIVYSDNNSYAVLTHELNESPRMTTYLTFRDLDVLSMMLAPKADYVSIQEYASLFPVLYNTGYLSREMSQYALKLLSESTFKDALVAGVPQNVRVSHKFGHRILSETESQLHDCGIVYHPSTSYVVCIMTSGSSIASEAAAIADLSRIVYDEISSLRLSR